MHERFLESQINPLHLFITGMICIPAYLFQSSLLIRLIQVLLFAVLSILNGKRIKWLYFVIMVATITFFNLLTPIGRVLYRAGPLVITSGAIEQGVLKGLTIVGLVFISLFSIRPNLRLPGRLGGLIGRVFLYYERVIDGKRRIEAKRLIASIDEVLEGLFHPGEELPEQTAVSVATSASGYLFAAVLLLLMWGSLVVTWRTIV